ncbi:Late competence protein ComGG [Streptococcus sp. DD10]|uniref:competence type IV pilus minor pilin ComGG n=1 Tax=Streptococcus sp. DD10 TaxID=1777878 RepID=UPI00079414AA|nr:competence type IV pilus minor pilin ComGG [Streptococcus sp. DD10]KXT74461.1 Late competence protein ComGG [Streptococcus sp. DD10]
MWKKKVKAGVLLYALLMVAIFSLVLGFYLNRQVATQRNLVLEQEKVTAYALATLSQKEAGNYNLGTSQVQIDKQTTKVEVDLQTGRSYVFHFPKKEEGKSKENDEKKAEKTKEDQPAEESKEKVTTSPTADTKQQEKIESSSEK